MSEQRKKYFAMGAGRSDLAQVSSQGSSNLGGQGQLSRASAFGRFQRHEGASPLDVVQSEAGDFPSSQTQPGQAEHHGTVPEVGGGLASERLEQLLELLWSEMTRQTSAPTGRDFGQSIGQRGLASSGQRQKLEKGAKAPSDNLEAGWATSFAFAGDVSHQVMRGQSLELQPEPKLLAVFF